ncbi:MAG: hypothetical protein ACT4PV_06735 [Planctomycetaceae bacterium]
MRLLAVGSALVLAVSLAFAPGFRQRAAEADDARFVEPDPRARALWGEREGALGVALSGYLAWADAGAGPIEAQRGAFKSAILLGAAALGQPGLEAEVLRPQVRHYLSNRAQLDPDGSVLREALQGWVDIRLDFHRQRNAMWLVSVSVAMYLPMLGDPRGAALLREFAARGPLYGELFRYARRYHRPFATLREMLEFYLAQGDLNGRVQAGATLVDYARIEKEGLDLLARYEPEIRAAFQEAVSRFVPFSDAPGSEDVDRGHTALHGLATLRGEEDVNLLRSIDPRRVGHYVTSLTLARIWAGIDPPLEIPGTAFDALDDYQREYYFRAACHSYAHARTEEEKRRWLKVMEAGLVWPDTAVQVYCFHALASLSPAHKDLPREKARERNVVALFAALRLPPDERLPYLLPGLSSEQGSFDYQAMAAVGLLEGR